MNTAFGNNIRKKNYAFISSDANFSRVINELDDITLFLDKYGYLTFGRDFVFCKKYGFSLQSIILSAEYTMGSIADCCRVACIADANTLLRKYRDDLFFYIYILIYDKNRRVDEPNEKDIIESNVEKWLQNGLRNLNISEVLKSIGMSKQLMDVVKKYNLQDSFNAVSERLNNYVHSNGYQFYNKSFAAYKEGELLSRLTDILTDAKYITTTFLFLVVLCSPLYVMATDYVDYLDCGDQPPLGSQYWVAPFVIEFLKQNVSLIDGNCYNYLKANTSMEF